MIQLKSEDFVFDEPKQSSQRRWFPARGASNEVQRLSDLFELPFLGHRSLQRRTINSIYLALSSLCLSFRLLAERAYERAGDPSEGLRGSLRFNPIVFQRQPPGGKQRKHRQPILSQTVYRLRGCLRITMCCVRSPVQEMSIHWFSQESDLAEFPFHVQDLGVRGNS